MLFRIANMFLGTGTDDGAADAVDKIGEKVTEQVKKIVQSIVPVVFAVIAAVGVIYGIILGVQYAKAEDTQKREEAKKRLINAIIGFGIAIVIAAVMWIVAGLDGVWDGLVR